MNSCMVLNATQQEQDRAREDWFAGRMERKRVRDEKEKKRVEQEKFHREWWGLPQVDANGKVIPGSEQPAKNPNWKTEKGGPLNP
jgi:COX assembly mitochondrial protein 1